MNKTELLQSILNQSDPDSEYYNEDSGNWLFVAEYRPRKGWWALRQPRLDIGEMKESI